MGKCIALMLQQMEICYFPKNQKHIEKAFDTFKNTHM